MNTWDMFGESTPKLSAREKFKHGVKRAGYDMDAGAKRLEDLLAKQKTEREAREKEEQQKQVNEDWQKVNKHDRTDGMSGKAVRAYRRENPGSKLKTAVTTKPSKLKKGGKAAGRRKSFCARMSGMKKHRAGAKTKRDPDSPINKALRRWNCESIEEMRQLIEYAEQVIAQEKLMEIKKGQKDSNGYTRCWPGKHAEGTKKGKNGGQVRNCVPNESVEEARMSAAVRMQRALEREKEKRERAERAGQELLNPKKDKEPKDSKTANETKELRTKHKTNRFKGVTQHNRDAEKIYSKAMRHISGDEYVDEDEFELEPMDPTRFNDDDFYAFDPDTMLLKSTWSHKSVGRRHHEHVANQEGWKVASGMQARHLGLMRKAQPKPVEEEWDEGGDPPNNFAVYINGRKWKVFKGRGWNADDRAEREHFQNLKTWCAKKSMSTGKKWEVFVTGEQATDESLAESREVAQYLVDLKDAGYDI